VFVDFVYDMVGYCFVGVVFMMGFVDECEGYVVEVG